MVIRSCTCPCPSSLKTPGIADSGIQNMLAGLYPVHMGVTQRETKRAHIGEYGLDPIGGLLTTIKMEDMITKMRESNTLNLS